MDSWVADIFGIIANMKLLSQSVYLNALASWSETNASGASDAVWSNNKTQRTVKCLFTLKILYLSHPHAPHHVNGCSLQNGDNKFYLLRHGCGRWNRSATKLKQSVACIISPCTVPKNTVHHVFKHLVIYAVLFRWWLSLTKDLRFDIKFADFTS